MTINNMNYRLKIVLLFFFVSLLSVQSQDLSKLKYEVSNVGDAVNTAYSNFGTSYYGDEVIFSSPVKRSYIINNLWKPNHQPYLDLYVGKTDAEGHITGVKKFSNRLNTKYHEGTLCFTKDLKRVYFTRNNYYRGSYKADSKGVNRLQLYTAKVDDLGNWVDVTPLPFNSREYSTGHPALSDDDQTLYFVSDRPGGQGGTDIYKVSVNSGSYGTPSNLGSSINTSGKEMFPYVIADELYYSSDALPGNKGGLDVYVSKSGKAPVNLVNLNSAKDDFGFIIDKTRRDGYFSSNREGGYGDDDVYYFKQEKIQKKKEYTCTYKVLVKDRNTNSYISDATVRILSGNTVVSQGKTDASGAYTYTQKCVKGAVYTIEGSKKPVYGREVSTSKAYSPSLLSQDFTLSLVPEFKKDEKSGKIIVKIDPIYFDTNKSAIRPDAALELDKVVRIMQKYPQLRIEAGSHTDSRGRSAYNQKLSERRAKSTVDYITSKGVSSDRISYRGYGESQLVNGCSNGVKCSKEEHQLNRRTEFVILNSEVLK